MMEIPISNRQFVAREKTALVDGALPARTDRVRFVIMPNAAARADADMEMVVTVFGPGRVPIATANLRGGIPESTPEGPNWPFEMSIAGQEGRPFHVEMENGGKTFRCDAAVQALELDEVPPPFDAGRVR